MRPPHNIDSGIIEKLKNLERGKFALIRVDDPGVGIPEENLGKIFKTFYTTKSGGEQTGLGLSICREIIARHGGLLDVESTFGKGSTFFIFLPL